MNLELVHQNQIIKSLSLSILYNNNLYTDYSTITQRYYSFKIIKNTYHHVYRIVLMYQFKSIIL